MKLYAAVLDGRINHKTVTYCWKDSAYSIAEAKSKVKKKLIDSLSWSNCFDTVFEPTQEEVNAYVITEVKLEVVL